MTTRLDERYEFVLHQLPDAFGINSGKTVSDTRSFFASLDDGDIIDFDTFKKNCHLSLDDCHCIADALVDTKIWKKDHLDGETVFFVRKRTVRY